MLSCCGNLGAQRLLHRVITRRDAGQRCGTEAGRLAADHWMMGTASAKISLKVSQARHKEAEAQNLG